jgi:hypothetical protein
MRAADLTQGIGYRRCLGHLGFFVLNNHVIHYGKSMTAVAISHHITVSGRQLIALRQEPESHRCHPCSPRPPEP